MTHTCARTRTYNKLIHCKNNTSYYKNSNFVLHNKLVINFFLNKTRKNIVSR